VRWLASRQTPINGGPNERIGEFLPSLCWNRSPGTFRQQGAIAIT